MADGFAARDGQAAEPGAEVLEEGTLACVRAHPLRPEQNAHVLVRCLQQVRLQLLIANGVHQLHGAHHHYLPVTHGLDFGQALSAACLVGNNLQYTGGSLWECRHAFVWSRQLVL